MDGGIRELIQTLNDIEKKIGEFMASNEAKVELQKTMAKSAESRVYPLYSPKQYVRRKDDGGLSDLLNYEVHTEGTTMTVANNTTDNSEYSDTSKWDIGFINDIIENGTGYHWRNSKIYKMRPYPRPFMESGVDDFVDTYLLPEIGNRFFDD